MGTASHLMKSACRWCIAAVAAYFIAVYIFRITWGVNKIDADHGKVILPPMDDDLYLIRKNIVNWTVAITSIHADMGAECTKVLEPVEFVHCHKKQVSGQQQEWRWELTKLMHEFLKVDGAMLIDVGAGNGYFSLQAAATGRQVLAVECHRANIDLMAAAVSRSDRALADRITLVHAAASDGYIEPSVRLEPHTGIGDDDDLAHNLVVVDAQADGEEKEQHAITVDTVMVDDAIPLFEGAIVRGEHVVLLVHAPAHNCRALAGAGTLLHAADVRHVVLHMERGGQHREYERKCWRGMLRSLKMDFWPPRSVDGTVLNNVATGADVDEFLALGEQHMFLVFSKAVKKEQGR